MELVGLGTSAFGLLCLSSFGERKITNDPVETAVFPRGHGGLRSRPTFLRRVGSRAPQAERARHAGLRNRSARGQPIQAVRRVVDAFGGTGTCTVIGGQRSAPDRAAMMNGCLVRYLDFMTTTSASGRCVIQLTTSRPYSQLRRTPERAARFFRSRWRLPTRCRRACSTYRPCVLA